MKRISRLSWTNLFSVALASFLVFSTSQCMVFRKNLVPKAHVPKEGATAAQSLDLQYSFKLGESRILSGMLIGDEDAIHAINDLGRKYGFVVNRLPPQADPAQESSRTGTRIRAVTMLAEEDASSTAIAAIMTYIFLGVIPWRSSIRYELKAETYENGAVIQHYFLEDKDAIWTHLFFVFTSPFTPAMGHRTLDNMVANYYEQLRAKEFAK